MATIKLIAQEAGVSTMTVSNVINKRTNKVSVATQEKIQALLNKYHYTPNLNARSLVSLDSKLIAVIEYAEDADDASISFNDPFLAELLANIESEVKTQNYFTLIRRVTKVEEITELRNNWNLAGAIVVGLNARYFEHLMQTLNVPTVFVDSYINRQIVDRVFKKLHRSMCFINSDDFDGSRQATDYLINSGRSKIGFLGFDYNTEGVVSTRLDGYKQALDEHRLPVDNQRIIMIKSKIKPTLEHKKIVRLIQNDKLDALVITSDEATGELLRYLHLNSEIKVPDELAVIGFDNLTIAKLLTPSLSTVGQDIGRKGKVAVNFLINAKQDQESHVEFINLPVNLIIRETT